MSFSTANVACLSQSSAPSLGDYTARPSQHPLTPLALEMALRGLLGFLLPWEKYKVILDHATAPSVTSFRPKKQQKCYRKHKAAGNAHYVQTLCTFPYKCLVPRRN